MGSYSHISSKNYYYKSQINNIKNTKMVCIYEKESNYNWRFRDGFSHI